MVKAMSSAESFVINLLAIIGGIGIVFITVYTYDTSVPQVDQRFVNTVAWLVANGMAMGGVYMVFTALAGFSPQTHPKLYLAAHLVSFVAFLAINYTFCYVIWQFVQSGQQIRVLADIPSSMHLIAMLWVFSWVNILWLEGRKHKTLLKYEKGNGMAPEQNAFQPGMALAANLVQQLMAAARIVPNLRIGPLKLYIEVDGAGVPWFAIDEAPTLTLTPAAPSTASAA